jgi:hypothetical protein
MFEVHSAGHALGCHCLSAIAKAMDTAPSTGQQMLSKLKPVCFSQVVCQLGAGSLHLLHCQRFFYLELVLLLI